VVLGPAGCGKTTLVANFGRWVEQTQGFRVGYVNLDPGAEEVPYDPDFDIREFIRVSEVMKEYHLGPNGAFIKCSDLMVEHLDKIHKGISEIHAEYILVDTPGQMELFVFRESGPRIISRLKGLGFPVAVILFDPSLVSKPSDFVALRLVTTVIQLRLDIDSIPVINKFDMPDAKRILELLESPELIKSELASEQGVVADLALSLAETMDRYSQATRIAKVSAIHGTGFEELYDILHEVYCTCGDLT